MRASHPETAWSAVELDCFAQSFPSRDHARASSQLYRTFLTKEVPRLRKGHYRSRRLAVPTRLLVGEADPLIRVDDMGGFEAYASEMSVAEVERAGHFIAEERPDVVVAEARELFGAAGAAS